MSGVTPLSEQNILVGQFIKQKIGVFQIPVLQFHPLPGKYRNNTAAILKDGLSVRVEGNAEIGAIYFFFDRDFMRQKFLPLRCGKAFIIAHVISAQYRKMGR